MKIKEYYVEVFLLPDVFEEYDYDVFHYIEIGDHFSLELEELAPMQGIHIDNISVWDESVLKIRYQTHLDPIDLGSDGVIYPSRQDVLRSPFPVNKSQLILHPYQDLYQKNNSSMNIYWSPFYDTMFELNETEIIERDYFLIDDDDLKFSDFFYETYLNLSFTNGNVTFTESHELSIELIGENEYYLASDNLYRETWFESYGIRDVSPARKPNSLHVIRK